MTAALGFRAHSGWAAVVAVGGSTRSPQVLDRRHIVIADPEIPGSKQPYHAAEGLPLDRAEKLVNRCMASTRTLSRSAVGGMVRDLAGIGHAVSGAGILFASGRPVTSLENALSSHAMLHTAEGDLFRNALVDASEHCTLAIVKIREREVVEHGAAELARPAEEILECVAAMGRDLGPPWRQDEKLAALVGWLALARKACHQTKRNKR